MPKVNLEKILNEEVAKGNVTYCYIKVPEITNEEKLDAISQSSARKGIDLDTKTKEFIINNTSIHFWI